MLMKRLLLDETGLEFTEYAVAAALAAIAVAAAFTAPGAAIGGRLTETSKSSGWINTGPARAHI